MEKPILNHHSVNVLAKCSETNEFLLGEYDAGYPGKNKHWIGRVKLLGGNYFFGKDSDLSPYQSFRREIGEELSGQAAGTGEMAADQQHNFAHADEIALLRDSLLSAEPFMDYLIHEPSRPIGNDKGVYVMLSTFRVNLKRDLIEVVKRNLTQGKSLTNEGLLTVRNLNELVSGKVMTQGISGLIIDCEENVNLPHCLKDLYTFAPVGKPRTSYKDYLDVFEYRDHSKR